MKRLWAPWRMEYLHDDKSSSGAPQGEEDSCVFCGLLNEEDGPGNLILHRSGLAYVVLNKYPYSNGHLMVVPNRHVQEFDALSDEEGAEIFRLTQKSIAILRRVLGAHGFNAGLNLGKAAGAGIAPHLHLHVVPRWEGDHNLMPVIGDIRVIPEHIEATYENLRAVFARELSEPSLQEGKGR